ncbi:MAG: VWA domain-containing protein [Clostridia bacterium]|nr:VWA domain-containing protein [Clostridia bacterium]MDH7573417.1 VWA domain-containing protein [Clostridia bacterium]
MFTDFFYLLRSEGVPVTLTEWMTFLEGLAKGLSYANLNSFYHLARATLVKSEAHFDRFDVAFLKYFSGIDTPEALLDKVWEWLANPLPPRGISPEELERWRRLQEEVDLEELQRQFLERLREQTEAHHGGSRWIGTGGTSPFGHSGYHPGGIRVGGESHARSAVKVAAERRFRAYRDDETLGVRQFEVALRRLRQLSTKVEGPKDELDLDGTIRETCRQGGFLELVWTRGRKNKVKVLLLMDVGGSMVPYSRLCSQLFTAVHRASHFQDLRFYYFHNCVYDYLYLDHACHPRNSVKTDQVLKNLGGDYKLIMVGDACMAPSELTQPGGIIWWGMYNEEPGLVWLERLARHFSHNVWLNPIPAGEWDTVYGHQTLNLIRRVFPMYELTVDGLTQAVKKLLVRR